MVELSLLRRPPARPPVGLSDSLPDNVCGGLTSTLVIALVDGLVDFATDPSGSALPDAYSYDGMGTYPCGSRRLEGTIEICYGDVGPLVELLGFGASPPNPLVIGLNDTGRLTNGVRGLHVQSVISLHDESGSSVITYDIESPRALVSALLTGNTLDLNAVAASGTRDALSQVLTVDTWDVTYVDGVGELDGEISFDVAGDNFPFHASLVYPQSNQPDVTISCQ